MFLLWLYAKILNSCSEALISFASFVPWCLTFLDLCFVFVQVTAQLTPLISTEFLVAQVKVKQNNSTLKSWSPQGRNQGGQQGRHQGRRLGRQVG